MRYINGLLKKKLPNWTGKEWYHQRFDGSPYYLHFIAKAQIDVHKDRKLQGYYLGNYCFFEDGKADWFMSIEDNERITNIILDAARKDPYVGKTLMTKWIVDEKAFYDKCKEIEELNLEQFSKEEIFDLHDEFSELILNRNSSSSLIDGFALGSDKLIADMIEKARLKSGIELSKNGTFSILTAPIHLSFINEAEISLLRVAQRAQLEGVKQQILDDISIEGTQTWNELKNHQERYFWTKNNYVSANVLDVEHFQEELKTIFESGIDVSEQIKKINSTPMRNKDAKKELMDKMNLPEELKVLIHLSEDFTEWQDMRKKATFYTIHYMTLILEQIANYLQINSELLKYTTCSEVSTYRINNPSSQMLENRMKKSVYFWDHDGMECVTGNEVDIIYKDVLGETDYSDIDDFQGLTAQVGIAFGTVKVVKSATEVDKVKEGDILVAVMTRPDYVPAMKKAAAIVTDEGGITCHAAIVSRELGVPCIIGTKIATKVLKDGDEVEVNANHGVVRKC